ncbi:MAG: LytTR family transcriptional regulator [Sphingopyxis sp.]|nr:LytTR family transcriptional regulator [Sphingopyxis sp.]
MSWLVGAIAGSLAARPLIYGVASVLRPMMEAPVLREMPPLTPTFAFFAYYLTNWSVVIIMWLAACWLASRWRRDASRPAPMAGSETKADAGPTEQVWESHGFLSRIPPALGRTVLALHSEDHYVRVFTERGEALVLAAISDAIRAVEAAGTAGHRVHRSWWVATAAVARSEATGRKLAVHLSNGVEVPVSQTYREVVRISGLIPSGANAF